MKTKMSEIQKDIFQVHKETSACMSNLEHLDTLKTKLQVRELQNVKVLSRPSESLFINVKTLKSPLSSTFPRSPKKVFKNRMAGVV